MLKIKGDNFKGKIVSIFDSGNVSQKATEFGVKVIRFSDSSGYIMNFKKYNVNEL